MEDKRFYFVVFPLLVLSALNFFTPIGEHGVFRYYYGHPDDMRYWKSEVLDACACDFDVLEKGLNIARYEGYFVLEFYNGGAVIDGNGEAISGKDICYVKMRAMDIKTTSNNSPEISFHTYCHDFIDGYAIGDGVISKSEINIMSINCERGDNSQRHHFVIHCDNIQVGDYILGGKDNCMVFRVTSIKHYSPYVSLTADRLDVVSDFHGQYPFEAMVVDKSVFNSEKISADWNERRELWRQAELRRVRLGLDEHNYPLSGGGK
jgi:hypothetical protein